MRRVSFLMKALIKLFVWARGKARSQTLGLLCDWKRWLTDWIIERQNQICNSSDNTLLPMMAFILATGLCCCEKLFKCSFFLPRTSRRPAAAGREIRGAVRKPVWRVTSPVCLYSCSTLCRTPRMPPPLCWSLRAPASFILGTLTPSQTQKVGLFSNACLLLKNLP